MNRRTAATGLNDHERIDLLETAHDLVEQAIENIRQAVRDTGLEARAEVYILPTLTMCLGDDHDCLGPQPANISELIQAIFGGE